MVKKVTLKITKMLKLVKIPVWTIILGLIGLIGSLTAYTYSRDTKKIDENSERINKIESTCITKNDLALVTQEFKKDLAQKVNKDAFLEFKEGQDKIMKAIQESSNREKIYQQIIKDLTFIDVDSIKLNLVKN